MLKCDKFQTGYFDESGDNGKRGSKWLVLTYVCTKDNKGIAKIIKKCRKQLIRDKKGERWFNRHNEIKFSGFPNQPLLKKTLEKLSKLKIQIRFISIEKKGHKVNPEEKKEIIPRLIVGNIVGGECMPSKVIADKDYFDNKKIAHFGIKKFKEEEYDGEDGKKQKKASFEINFIEKENLKDKSGYHLIVKINHENSRQNVSLQATDLISGAIFQEIENNDPTYLQILKKNNKDIKGVKRT